MSREPGGVESDSDVVFGGNALRSESGVAQSFETLADGSLLVKLAGVERKCCVFAVWEKDSNLKLSGSDLVWAKVRSYPWWPGQVFDASAASVKAMKHFKKGKLFVAYFGDYSFAWNDASVIKPFHQHFSQMEKQSNSPVFQDAIDCALEEVSRRVEFGLSCPCISEEAYNKLKTQSIINPGIREDSSVRYGGDELSSAIFFEPAKFVDYMKQLACFPSYGETDKLQFTKEKTLSDIVANKTLGSTPVEELDGKSHSEKKRNVESSNSGKPEKKRKNNRQKEASASNNSDEEINWSVGRKLQKVATPCFATEAISLRVERELISLVPTPNVCSYSNSTSKVEVESKKREKPELEELAQKMISSKDQIVPDEMLSSFHEDKTAKGIPESISIDPSNYEGFEKVIEEISCDKLNDDSKKASITETSVSRDVKLSSEKKILPANKESAGSGSKEQTDCCADSSAPYALILKFADSGKIPSEEKLNSIFNRYGPLRESETQIMKKGKRAKVVFESGEDAKTAFSSSGKYSIFGPSLLSYSLKFVCPKAKQSNTITT
ncbi:hypothetical protein EUTSA_v10015666mg [Eutrema salsugineum]|uniref:PWWP domain-containing protein n=1 Tax=Eutrema salsugineum TaxID=72664 RepID=V4LK76_EUTSA|nr:hypothetical protein EUTSA_v10015666mg [Eutrema salsugineum]